MHLLERLVLLELELLGLVPEDEAAVAARSRKHVVVSLARVRVQAVDGVDKGVVPVAAEGEGVLGLLAPSGALLRHVRRRIDVPDGNAALDGPDCKGTPIVKHLDAARLVRQRVIHHAVRSSRRSEVVHVDLLGRRGGYQPDGLWPRADVHRPDALVQRDLDRRRRRPAVPNADLPVPPTGHQSRLIFQPETMPHRCGVFAHLYSRIGRQVPSFDRVVSWRKEKVA